MLQCSVGDLVLVVLDLIVQLSPVVEEGVPHHGLHLVGCLLLTGQRFQSVGQLLYGLTWRVLGVRIILRQKP